MHPQEALLIELRATRRTAEGRKALRQRTDVEHTLARIAQLQGTRARYKGTRKNTFDLRRMAAVNNLQHRHRGSCWSQRLDLGDQLSGRRCRQAWHCV